MKSRRSHPDIDSRVLVLTPTGADSVVAAELLSGAGIEAQVCSELGELCDELRLGAGAVLVAQEALRLNELPMLAGVLEAQPPWSDISLIILTTGREGGYSVERLTKLLGAAANVTFLERPLQAATLITNLRAALRARNRQYEVRELLRREWLARSEQAAATRALAESEERFRLVLSNVRDHAIFTLDLDGNVSSWNVGAENVFGYPAEEILGKPADILFTPEDREQGRPDEERRLAAVRSCADDTRWHLRRGGERFFTSGSMEGLRDAGGKLLGYVKVVRDITAQRHLEVEREQLLESERAARLESERISRMKDEFLATLSHELRTPLNAILGWTQLLRRIGPHAKDFMLGIDTIERNTKMQAQLIADLLDMSSIIRGKVRLDMQRTDPAEALEAAVVSAEPAARAAGVELSRQFEQNLGSMYADARRFQQILWNLLSNAIKFTPKGGKVEVRARRVNGAVEISVSDTGRGIKPEFIPTIFERFRQEDASITRRYGGMGIGLSLVKSLSEMHGGSVSVESGGEGRGARFTVTLPSAAPERIPAEAGVWDLEEQMLDSYHPPTLQGVTVLVVDDDEDSREIIRRILEENDASVVAVGSAAEAMKAISCEAFDLIVSDIGMPEIDGYQLMRHLRRLPAHLGGSIPSVALTAFSREQDRAKALNSGYQAHLAKPVDAGELVSVLSTLYSSSREAVAQNG